MQSSFSRQSGLEFPGSQILGDNSGAGQRVQSNGQASTLLVFPLLECGQLRAVAGGDKSWHGAVSSLQCSPRTMHTGLPGVDILTATLFLFVEPWYGCIVYIPALAAMRL